VSEKVPLPMGCASCFGVPSVEPARRRKHSKYGTDGERREAIRAGQRRRYRENREAELARFRERDARLRAADPLKFRKRDWRKNGNAAAVVRGWYRQQFRRTQAELLVCAAWGGYEAWFDALDGAEVPAGVDLSAALWGEVPRARDGALRRYRDVP
jgi:hypothetical protein